jgi:carboxyl-terminal processing protease
MSLGTHIRRSWCALVLCSIAVGEVWSTTAPAEVYQGVNDSWDRFGAVYSRVVEHYYQDLDHEELMRAAIDGMLQELDSYSQFFDAEGLRQLRQDTTGKFAGLGITVGIKDHYPVVISPIADTPAHRAGMLPGDLIVAIEGEDTFGTSLEQVVSTLRGEPGSEVRITLARLGERSRWDVVIERQTIKIKSVAVSGQIAPGVGYISMRQTRFSEETAAEVEAALKELIAEEAAALILDLRGNPGGLLSQATQVADLFLSTGDPIVSIRERNRARAGERGEEMRYSQRRPLAADLPLVVLIDGGSASAAEIVAGAIQDNDRGLVIGTTSFGKGSVQTIFELRDRESAALKLTTALYYTPSGRSIHRQGLALPRGLLLHVPLGDTEVPVGMLLDIIAAVNDEGAASAQLRAKFGLEKADVDRVLSTTIGELVVRSGALGRDSEADTAEAPDDFVTRNGRRLLSGGGIVPDVRIELIRPPPYVRELQRRRIFFDFIVDYIGGEGDSLQHEDVDDRMLSAFKQFIPTRRPDSQPWSEGEAELDALRSLAVETDRAPEAKAVIDTLEAILQGQRGGEPFSPAVKVFVRAGLKKELALRLSGREASLLAELENDVQIEEAVAIVGDLGRYRRLLGGG